MDSFKKFDIGWDQVSHLHIEQNGSGLDVEIIGNQGLLTTVSGKLLAVMSELKDNEFQTSKLIVQDNATVYSRIVKEAVNEYWSKGTFSKKSEIELVKKGFLGRLFGKKLSPRVTLPIFQRPENPMIILFHVLDDCDEKDATKFLNALNFTNNSGIFCIFIGMGKSSFSLLRVVGGRYDNCEFLQLDENEDLTMEHLLQTRPLNKFREWCGPVKVEEVVV